MKVHERLRGHVRFLSNLRRDMSISAMNKVPVLAMSGVDVHYLKRMMHKNCLLWVAPRW